MDSSFFYIFNDIQPDWDYSWYNKDNLIGFEDEIREILSKSDFYKPEILEFMNEYGRRGLPFYILYNQNFTIKKNVY